MASILAVISKAIFERHHRGARVGHVLALERYDSTQSALEPLSDGGTLFLVTVRPKEQLWLVAVLENPQRDTRGWFARRNTSSITDISPLRSQLFAAGRPLPKEAGKLGMALQRPRQLDPADLALLQRASGTTPRAATTPASPAGPTNSKPAAHQKAPSKKTPARKTTSPRAVIADDSKKATPNEAGPQRGKVAKPKAPAAMGADALEAAARLVAGDSSQYPHLLRVWRRHPSIALGDVLERHAPSDEVAEALLGTSGQLPAKQLISNVQALAALAADPRISSRLVSLLEAPPFTAQSMKPMWLSLFQQLVEQHADPRSLPRLEKVNLETTFGMTTMSQWMAKQLAVATPKLADRFTEPPILEQEAALAALIPRQVEAAAPAPKVSAPPDTEADLLTEIATHPDNDDVRLVYADWVAQQGDEARAEFIQLQLARARSGEPPNKRELALLKKHAHSWLGPIVPVLVRNRWSFERGFLDTCTILPRKAHAAKLAGHPLWGTLRRADLHMDGDPGPILVHSVMRNLRAVRFFSRPRGLEALLDSDSPIEELYNLHLTEMLGPWEAFAHCSRLPHVRYMELSSTPGKFLEACTQGWRRQGLQIVVNLVAYGANTWWQPMLDNPLTAGMPDVLFRADRVLIQLDASRRALICNVPTPNDANSVAWALNATGYKVEHAFGDGAVRRIEMRLNQPLAESEQLATFRKLCQEHDVALEERVGNWPALLTNRYAWR